MLKKEAEWRQALAMLCTDMLVPQDRLLRKTGAEVDFNYLYGIVEELYCEDSGQPSCDAVALFKLDRVKHSGRFGRR